MVHVSMHLGSVARHMDHLRHRSRVPMHTPVESETNDWTADWESRMDALLLANNAPGHAHMGKGMRGIPLLMSFITS